ncbi:MAG: hypothetical protein HY253_08150 [Burkholderiales bacterium]|nr:hypothetical protein [Burkholderiales bacterium]
MRILLRLLVIASLVSILFACTTPPPQQSSIPEHLFHDQLFAAQHDVIDHQQIFKVNPAMRQFIATYITPDLKHKSMQQALFDALYHKGQLRLTYDASVTRDAADTFAARAGNCLSLVIMTAALAKELDLTVQYQHIIVDQNWSRSGELYFSNGHVNIVLGKKRFDTRQSYDKSYWLTIDFLPPEDTAGQKSFELEEKTIIAMYMNNRAAEALARNQLDQAYWWAREAIASDANFATAYNTLGVIYYRHNNLDAAYQASLQARRLSPENTSAMANMVQILTSLGKVDEAKKLNAQLTQAQPIAPFYFFKQGLAAMEKSDFKQAKLWFEKELARAPDYHEFHFWLGLAHYRLGEFKQAEEQLTLAKASSLNKKDHALYQAKLDHLHSISQQGRGLQIN